MAASAPSTRTIVRILLTIVVIGFALYLLYLVRAILLLLFVSVFLALALGPPVGFLTRRGVPRAAAILLNYLVVLLVIVGMGLVLIPPVAGQVNKAVRDLPHSIGKLRENKTYRKYDNKYHITRALQKEANKLPSRIGDAAKALSSVTVGAFSAVTKLITVLAMTFLLIHDGERLVGFLLRLFKQEDQPRVRAIANDVYRSVSGYVTGNLAISVIAGLVAYVALRVLGVPFAGPLAILVGVFDLIPLVGASIASIGVAIVTLFHNFPTATIAWAIVTIVYQQVENNLIQPVVYRRTVAVPPLLVIVAVLVGGTLLGVLGALVALPVAAAIQIVVRDVLSHRNGTIGEPA
jgi:predicted PurR-regulated permease PerM